MDQPASLRGLARPAEANPVRPGFPHAQITDAPLPIVRQTIQFSAGLRGVEAPGFSPFGAVNPVRPEGERLIFRGAWITFSVQDYAGWK